MGTYLRVLISPSILLNTLCIFVLARSRLSNKSITVVFLRFLAVFDILAITLKFIRAEINYQSIVKMRDVSFMTPFFCKTLYVSVIILALANSPFIKLADVGPANNQRVFCGLIKYSLIIDITTASILPIALATTVNILIAATLHRVSHTPFDWFVADEKVDLRSSTMSTMDKKFLPNVYPLPSSKSSSVIADTRQVTRMF
ncbi:unnamed protein product [Rotaria socialis]|uniref:Uncharacterized protein n=2 Tax=Rotaria socialis TaxID=392032 RepID=A0A818S5N8_9BILA|nr:unnamed protein product [Rotaria socialis]